MSAAKSVLILLAAMFCTLPAPVPASAGHGNDGRSGKKEVRLLFTGDILLSRGVERRFAKNPQALARGLRPIFSGADWVVGNLEGAVGSADDCLTSAAAAPCFPVRSDFLSVLSGAGFNAIGLANNHSSDLGEKGLEATRSLLAQNGVTPLTLEDSPQFVCFDDVTIGVVSFSLIPGKDGCPVEATGAALRQKLRTARSLSNLTVVYVHWGSEFLDWPDKKQRRTAEWLIQNGADLIIGHHPHLIQPPELIHGKPVYFSLGNFVFDQKYPSTREGMLADCRIKEEAVSCSGLVTRTPPRSTLPAPEETSPEPGKRSREYHLQLAPPLRLGDIAIGPRAAPAGTGSSGLALEASHAGKSLWKTRPARIASIEPMRVDNPAPAQYLFTLERHYSPLDGEEGLRPCVYEAGPDGLIPRWRGSALAWPLIDALFLPQDPGILCALHRGDSFIAPQPESDRKRIAAYRWKGFGFSGVHDPAVISSCRDLFR